MVPASTLMYGSIFCSVTRKPARLQQRPDRGRRQALAQRRDDAAGHEDVFRRHVTPPCSISIHCADVTPLPCASGSPRTCRRAARRAARPARAPPRGRAGPRARSTSSPLPGHTARVAPGEPVTRRAAAGVADSQSQASSSARGDRGARAPRCAGRAAPASRVASAVASDDRARRGAPAARRASPAGEGRGGDAGRLVAERARARGAPPDRRRARAREPRRAPRPARRAGAGVCAVSGSRASSRRKAPARAEPGEDGSGAGLAQDALELGGDPRPESAAIGGQPQRQRLRSAVVHASSVSPSRAA